MDNTDPEIEFHIGHGDRREPVESPRRNVRGHSENREHDDLNKRHRRCCYGPPRPSIVIKPDSYTGDEDWEQYLSHFENCAELGQWTDKEMLLTLAASLKGQARAFYTSLASADMCSYERLTMSLEQRFGSARQQARWLSKFQSRSKLYGESIANFGDDLRQEKPTVTWNQKPKRPLCCFTYKSVVHLRPTHWPFPNNIFYSEN